MSDTIQRNLPILLRQAAAIDQTFVGDIQRDAADEIERLWALLNTPQTINFADAVVAEAAHQRERWGDDHDGRKTPADWFWTLGYLGGKALNAAINGDTEKLRHHQITTAALLANWHRLTRETPGPQESGDG